MLYSEIQMILKNRISPKIYKKKNEFCGIQYGEIKNDKIIKKVLLTLDLNLAVIHYAIKHKIDLILSHHGFIIRSIDKFNKILINKLNLLSKYPVSIYIMGSPFISVEEGISETISKMLYLRIENLFKVRNNNNKIVPIGRISSPICYPNERKDNFTLEHLLKRIKTNFSMDQVSYVGNLNKELKKICIVGGNTDNFHYLEKAKKKDCDCYISCNINHNNAIYCREIGLDLINLSHHNVELLTLVRLQNYLSLEFPYDEIFLYESDDPFKMYT
ncbi:MAG: Nif3-like dinuclear metal center hexameric protein [Candidatus Lokiarchaeota archaeon]|nr:Nif3-like dinuclear metal center hexameric protein [Candidatus Lokiarchaeota archaeon]